jgi:ferredoxin-nitrite reductase
VNVLLKQMPSIIDQSAEQTCFPSYFPLSPNSCGVVQAADIGIMGGPAKKLDPVSGKMKAVSGCKIFVGGTVGEDMHLSLNPYVSGIPLDEEDLVPVLVDILKTKFGAKDKD